MSNLTIEEQRLQHRMKGLIGKLDDMARAPDVILVLLGRIDALRDELALEKNARQKAEANLKMYLQAREDMAH